MNPACLSQSFCWPWQPFEEGDLSRMVEMRVCFFQQGQLNGKKIPEVTSEHLSVISYWFLSCSLKDKDVAQRREESAKERRQGRNIKCGHNRRSLSSLGDADRAEPLRQKARPPVDELGLLFEIYHHLKCVILYKSPAPPLSNQWPLNKLF